MSQLEKKPDSQGHTARPTGSASTGAPERSFVPFHFEGRSLQGQAGDSIAAALFRHGIRTLSWSIKYHRPRSIFCGRGRCSMCQVEVDGRPGIKACTTPLSDGMNIRRQNFRPFFAPLLSAAARILPLPAGFYFRAFTRPMFLRRMFLGTLRRMAGVIQITPAPTEKPLAPPPPRKLRREYDVTVIGAGLSGIQAALSASQSGKTVLLLDEYSAPGGHRLGFHPDPELIRRRDELRDALAASSVEQHFSATVQGVYPPDQIAIALAAPGHTQRVETIRAGAIVFATGAHDAIPLFENNDLPGVFGARGLRLFLERDRIVPGKNALIYGTRETAEDMAELLRAHDIGVAAVATTEEGARLTRANGRGWVSGAVLDTPSGKRSIACDLVCIALPGQPAFELLHQAGFRFAFPRSAPALSADEMIMVPTAREVENNGCRAYVVGEAAGITDWREALKDAMAMGHIAGGGS